jgi:hypothetical protein
MTTVYYAGGEQATHRKLLAEAGVKRFAFNLSMMGKLVKNLRKWDVAAHLPEGSEFVVYTDRDTSWEVAAPFVEQQPALLIGPARWENMVGDYEGFAPWWYEGMTDLLTPYLAIPDEQVKNQSTLRRLLADYSNRVLCAVTGTSRSVERLDVLVTNAWWEPMKHGETQVWAGNRIQRYNNASKTEARRKHQADIERLGIDYERVLADDGSEAARLAIASWQQWEERHVRRAPNLIPLLSNGHSPVSIQDGSVELGLPNASTPVRHERPRRMIPGVVLEPIISKYTDAEGRETIEETPALRMGASGLRHCDTCFLARTCPAFQPSHDCAYEIPIEIRTKDQLQAVMRALVEMQGQRVLFARFAEELDGQGLDNNLSMELDRFFRLLKDMKDVSDTRDIFRLEMEAKGNSGMLSRLFGSNVGSNARALSAPISSDEVVVTFEE